MVLEVDLDNFVGKSEHNCVFGPHPFLHIHDLTDFPSCTGRNGLLGCVFLEESILLLDWSDDRFLPVSLQVGFEVLQERYFFVNFLRVVAQSMGLNNFLLICHTSLEVIKSFSGRFKDYLCRIIEENSSSSI